MRFNLSWLAALLLAGSFIYSAIQVFRVSRMPGAGYKDNVIRVIHWQLEPGYREGLQWAIDEYNNLPHVKEAGIRVEQQGVTQKVYGQFMNIHMIGGTGPDIAQNGTTRLIRGNAIARFYAPLSDYVTEPNPYNSPEFLPEGLDPELAEMLATSAWSETLIDGMKGGYEEKLNDFYSIPVSTPGDVRLFYNMKLASEAKAVALDALAMQPHPEWLRLSLRENGAESGFIPESPKLVEWLNSGSPPETLGQLLLLCEAILQISTQPGREGLVPIAASSFSNNDVGNALYRHIFMLTFGHELDLNDDNKVDSLEIVHNWQQGRWGFESTDAIRKSIELMQLMTRYYPPGFLGLDREQSQRRFVQGNAMIVSTGGWDAKSIFEAVNNLGDEQTFEIAVTREPLGGEGEIYAEYLTDRPSEAEFEAGVPLSLNKQSPHPEEALDFLRFLTSIRVNEELNRRAGWLPVTIGAEAVEELRPFSPEMEGLPPKLEMNLRNQDLLAQIRNTTSGSLKLVLSGGITYEEFIERCQAAFSDPRLGADRQWFEEWQQKNDHTFGHDQSLNVESVRQYLLNDDSAQRRRLSRLYSSITGDQGYWVRELWRQYHPDEPFPSK